jgi:hypothetical protein
MIICSEANISTYTYKMTRKHRFWEIYNNIYVYNILERSTTRE